MPDRRATVALLFALVASACGSNRAARESSTPANSSGTAGTPATTPTASADSGATTAPPTTAGGAECATDDDCVRATCCHATSCTARAHAPVCSMMCTQDCRGGTLDCGGTCACEAGHCTAHFAHMIPAPNVH